MSNFEGQVSKMKKFKWIVIGAIVCVAVIFVYYSSTQGIETETVMASMGEITQYIEETAVVVSKNSQTVYSEGAGKITYVNVEIGDTVRKDELLAALDTKDLELQLKDAEAKVEAAVAQLQSTETVNYENKIKIAQVTVEQAQIAFDRANRDLESAQALYDAGALSKSELDSAQTSYGLAKASLNSAVLEFEEIQKGASDYVKQGYMAQVEQAKAYRDIILRNIKKQRVIAPISGVVIDKLVYVNSIVPAATPAFVIGSTDELELAADILVEDIDKVSIGNFVEISGKSIGNAILKGKVSKIAPAAKTAVSSLGVNQKRVAVTIALTEGIGSLKPGFSVDIKIITMQKSDVISIPDSAVFEYDGYDSVLVIENGKTVIRKVNRGIESRNSVEILEGLNENESVVVKPDNDIKEGMKIKY